MPALESEDLNIATQEIFLPGAYIPDEIERCIGESRFILALLTPDYLVDGWPDFEAQLVHFSDPAARDRRLIPLLLKPCEPPARIRRLHWVDLTDPSRYAAQMERIISAVRDSSPLPELKQLVLNPPVQRPPRAPHFVNREAELQQLLHDLQPGRVVTICGTGGLGKTSLAAETIHALALDDEPPERFPDGILFHSFYNQPSVDIACEHIVRSFHQEPKPTPRSAAARVLANRTLIFVLDGTENADDLSALLDIQQRNGILLTTRNDQDDPNLTPLDLTPLPESDGAALLRHWTGDGVDGSTADAIAELVGYLPLALRLAGRYLARRQRRAVTAASKDAIARKYQKRLQESPLAALDHGQRRQDSIPLLIARTLEPLSDAARALFATFGLLALAPVPTQVLSAALAQTEEQVDDSASQLMDVGLLQPEENGYGLTHPLIHTYTNQRCTPPDKALSRLADYYASFFRSASGEGLPGYKRLGPHRLHLRSLLRSCSDRQFQ